MVEIGAKYLNQSQWLKNMEAFVKASEFFVFALKSKKKHEFVFQKVWQQKLKEQTKQTKYGVVKENTVRQKYSS